MVISAPTPTLAAVLTQRVFRRNELIPFSNDVLWRIEQGVVRTVTWDEEGRLIALGYWGVGEIIGFPLSRLSPYQIECLTEVEVSQLSPELWDRVLDAILRHSQQVEELLSIVHQQPLQSRLWQFLVFLSKKFGRDVETGRLLELSLTHQQLAEALGTTRVTVTHSLQQLQSEGKLRRSSRRLILCCTT